jgi:hypothetical protein
MSETEYQPGTCNINPIERKKRLVAGLAGFTNSALLVAVIAFVSELTLLYPAIFLLNFVGFLGWLQYRKRFCTGLALRKKFHIGEKEEEIEDSEKVAEDRRKAFTLLVESAFLAFLTTCIVYILI